MHGEMDVHRWQMERGAEESKMAVLCVWVCELLCCCSGLEAPRAIEGQWLGLSCHAPSLVALSRFAAICARAC